MLEKHEARRLKSRRRVSYLYKLETPPSFMAVNYTSPRMPSSTLFESRCPLALTLENKRDALVVSQWFSIYSDASKRICRLRGSYCSTSNIHSRTGFRANANDEVEQRGGSNERESVFVCTKDSTRQRFCRPYVRQPTSIASTPSKFHYLRCLRSFFYYISRC